MKNRLQFNRIPTIFSGETRTQGGEEVWVSGREQAAEALDRYIKRGSFIPLIGEPIVLRYTDDKGDRQVMLAIGKSTGATIDMVGDREYHIIDSAYLQEGVDQANENASEALELASAATKDTADYLTILKNMILSGIGLTDGTYFDNNGRWDRDPSGVGLYDPDKVDDTFYLKEATSFLDADKKLDAAIVATNALLNGRADNLQQQIDDEHGYRKAIAIKEIDQQYYERLGLGDDIKAAYFLTTHKPGVGNFDQYDYPQNGEVIIKVYKDEVSREEFENVLAAEGLNPDGTYDHERAHESINFKDAFDAFTADELLDRAISELSANTMAADQALADRIEELEGHEIFGQDAIETEEDENGDVTVSLKIYENEKVLSQSNQGLRSTISLDYRPSDDKIYLLGIDGQEISHIDTSDFVRDGMIDEVKIITPTQEWIDDNPKYAYANLEAGKPYLWITFNTDSEKSPKDVFIRLDSLVDTYTVNPYSGGTSMLIDDYVITLVIDNALDNGTGLASWKYASSISAVTDNIIEAAGLTIAGPGGKYPGHSGITVHFINNANSLDNADVLLDAAIWETSGLVADISNRVDELSAVTREFSAHTVEALSALSRSVDERIESGLTIISGVVENYVESMLSAINFDDLYESACTYVDNSVEALSGALLDFIIDDEEVTAAALNDLNNRLRDLSGDTLNGLEELSGSVVNNESAITILSGVVVDNEEVTAAALNDLNRRVLDNDTDIERLFNELDTISGKTCGVLTLNLNGVEQGKYSPSANTTINLEAIQDVTGEDVLLTNYIISSGSTEEELKIEPTDNVNQAFGKLEKVVNDNEKVTAAALNDLNNRILNLSGSGASEQDIKALSASVVTNKMGITNLSAYTKDVDDKVDELSAGTVQGLTFLSGIIEDNELVIAAAFNDLNSRVLDLSQEIPDMSNYYNKTEVNGMVKREFTATTGATALVFDKFLTIITLGSSSAVSVTIAQSGSLWSNMEVGEVVEAHVIIENTGATGVTVTLPTRQTDSRIRVTGDNELLIDPSGFGEVNAMITKTGNNDYVIYLITSF